jgi:hypothetical protein
MQNDVGVMNIHIIREDTAVRCNSIASFQNRINDFCDKHNTIFDIRCTETRELCGNSITSIHTAYITYT